MGDWNENWVLSNELVKVELPPWKLQKADVSERPNQLCAILIFQIHIMTISQLSLHHGNTESRKNLEQKFIFQLGTPYPHRVNERPSFH